jgi:hypothetical protein
MPRVGFETTISVFEWAKTVHVLDSAATVIGLEELKGEKSVWIVGVPRKIRTKYFRNRSQQCCRLGQFARCLPSNTYDINLPSFPYIKSFRILFSIQSEGSRCEYGFTSATYRVFRAQADWTFILPSGFPTKELRHLPRRHHVLKNLISLDNEHHVLRCNKCGAYSERPTPPLIRRGDSISRHVIDLWMSKIMDMGPDGARKQKRMCWRTPTANYCSALSSIYHSDFVIRRS